MRIKPIAFNYGELLKDFPGTEANPQRKNMVLYRPGHFTMWGEHIDPEGQKMMLTSISIAREYTKNKDEKPSIINEWENFFHQYATDEQPEEILAKIEERDKKEQQRKEEAAKRAEEKAKQAAEKAKVAAEKAAKEVKQPAAPQGNKPKEATA